MAKLFILLTIVPLLLLLCCCGSNIIIAQSTQQQEAPVYLTATTTFFDSLSKSVVVPAITDLGKNFTVPPISLPDVLGIQLNTSSFKLQSLSVSTMQFAFLQPSTVQVSLAGIGIETGTIDFVLADSTLKLTCPGILSITVANGAATISLLLILNTTGTSNHVPGAPRGKLDVGNVTATADLTNVNVTQTLHGNFACTIASDLLSKAIDKLIDSLISKFAAPAIGSLLSSVLSDVFNAVPLPLAGAPATDDSNQGMTLPFDLVDSIDNISSASSRSSLPLSLKTGRRFLLSALSPQSSSPYSSDFFRNRDLSLAVSSAAVNVLLAELVTAGKLDVMNVAIPTGKSNKNLTTAWLRAYIPMAYYLCPNCELLVSLTTPKPASVNAPMVSFSSNGNSNNVSLQLRGSIMNITAKRGGVNNSSNSVVELFSLGVVAAGSLYDINVSSATSSNNNSSTTLRFKIELDNMQLTVAQSKVGKLDPKVLTWVLKHALNTLLLPIINEVTSILGLPLNPIRAGNVTASQVELQINNGIAVLGVNVKF